MPYTSDRRSSKAREDESVARVRDYYLCDHSPAQESTENCERLADWVRAMFPHEAIGGGPPNPLGEGRADEF